MQILRNFSLKNYNTFGIDVKADRFISVEKIEELKAILRKTYSSEVFLIGGGSNILLTGDVDKLVIHINLQGIEVISEDENEVLVKAMAGENWHQFVLWTLDHGFGGLQNLSLIPGNVGTAPIQNIGAYGVELKDNFVRCSGLHIQTLQEKNFELDDCNFGYRNSVFKNELKGQYILTSVTFKLSKKDHQLSTEYGAIKTELQKENISDPTIKDISNAVIKIRESKLPDPRKLGNSGSFFKNPVISLENFRKLQEGFPDIPSYTVSENEVKIPAGWLIEQSGLKGYKKGNVGVHEKQALVLVNYGNASGEEILELSKLVQDSVKEKFGIQLEAEVNII
ncbi:UDP-N-acetylenolpyruvoylglucosamine reductase [Christiangramia fulva]|uniref:UDP-N-acetylenolpyruvoylglucosamine reductase n=1 Tax=Christiangramia fulva TaxID=2126553 RepID=A0A2R3Z1B3_9FLAO|nr:UDP-N-acetylmuramate dehydrogenase [Christiangramia fulva]AVR44038.1 UDP-N-acetylenolpyruvoylglucosamine reductase [Christiangramia fulva]